MQYPSEQISDIIKNDQNQNSCSTLRDCISDPIRLQKLATLLSRANITIFEYYPAEDVLLKYNEYFQPIIRIPDYFANLDIASSIHPDDFEQLLEFHYGNHNSPIEIRSINHNGRIFHNILDSSFADLSNPSDSVIIGIIHNVTMERRRVELLKAQAMRDPLTTLYNHTTGTQLINEYLDKKTPYSSCALMVIDIDYFKNVNDNYGHLFGDKVLSEFARVLLSVFGNDNILIRAGGDEFVIFLKDVRHNKLLNKGDELLASVRNMVFTECDYSPTCSVGICFLPENISGYTYEQLFENADWALYNAKRNGRNRYMFCDSLKRFEFSASSSESNHPHIDARYFRNDIISCAFEIFEKKSTFDAAIKLLLEIIGIRFGLDRISIIETDIKNSVCSGCRQWSAPGIPKVLESPSSFTKEDFLTLFHSYDENGTTVLQYDNLEMYSAEGASLLVQGNAKTVVYSAMYCEGMYVGAISYVVCKAKRCWSKDQLSQLGELTKLISAHLAKTHALNASHKGIASVPEYDHLTGLLSFTRFRDEVERIIVGNEHQTYVMVYTDLEDFKYFNQKCGYSMGDQLLKEFTRHITSTLKPENNVYFTRIIADQFALFMPYTDNGHAVEHVEQINNRFIDLQKKKFSNVTLRMRTGIYLVNPGCASASSALDCANYARQQVRPGNGRSVIMYDEALSRKRHLENEVKNNMTEAMSQGQFQVYLQPKFSMQDLSIVGAEALVRWHKPDGTILSPGTFIPTFEQNGRITELDYYVFDKVVQFLDKNNSLGRKQVPISINASILHASDPMTVQNYLDILNKYHVDPSLTEIELTETATVSKFDSVRTLFQHLQAVDIKTSMDDFGAGYSVLNTVIDIPVNTVKIDRLFIEKCTSSKRGIYFLKEIVTMVKGLGYHVLCEGVETEEQLEILREIGCETGQGIWFCSPLPICEYEEFVYGKIF